MSTSQYISKEIQETFERFLLNKMTSDERDNFLEKLRGDKNLNKEFYSFKTMFRTVEEHALKEKLDLFHKDMDSLEKGKSFKLNKNFYLIAASVTLFLFLGSYWFLNKQPKNEELYATYFSPDPGLPTVMGNSDNYNFYEAMVDYKQANYKIAIYKWELLLKEKPNNDTLNYFLGVSHLNINNTDNASFYLHKVTPLQTSVFYSDARLYLGLIQLKKNDIKKAKEQLTKSDSETAKLLLKALE